MAEIQYLNGSEPTTDTIKRTQVYQATHDGEGKRLPFLNRAFISFSYGGRYIEDFNLIAVTNGDRLSHPIYADFTDHVSDNEVVDGQLYWGTHFKANTWELTLVTDGMTENQLDSFKQWFAPGKIRELILAEHPHRAILARVSQVPVYSMIPFETEATTTINRQTYTTSTTLYKGEISLTFIMDKPFWYATSNLLNVFEDTQITSKWENANGELEEILQSNDALKIIVEDDVVIIDMFPKDETDEEQPAFVNTILMGDGQLYILNTSSSRVDEAYIGQAYCDYYYSAVISGIHVMDSTTPSYFYYGGTASSGVKMSFELTPQIDNETGYIVSPFNLYTGTTYNTITIESIDKTEFKFTTPGVLTGYNEVINILNTIGENVSWEEVKILIRDRIKHYASRAYGIYAIEQAKGTSLITSNATLVAAREEMQNFLTNGGSIVPIQFEFDSDTGKAIASITYKYGNTFESHTENVGDMVLSNYLKIQNRNHLNPEGEVTIWTEAHPEYSHKVYTDVPNGLSDFKLKYKYLYF